jgi:hypothetical protein
MKFPLPRIPFPWILLSLRVVLAALFLGAGLPALQGCTKPPKPRTVADDPGAVKPKPAVTRQGGTLQRTDEPPKSSEEASSAPASVSPTASPMVTPTATPMDVSANPAAAGTVGVPPADAPQDPARATQTPGSRATPSGESQGTTRGVSLKASFAGGWFKNCLTLKMPGQAAPLRVGCTKVEGKSPQECVGIDKSFREPRELPGLTADAKQKLGVTLETFRQTTRCDGDAGFTYDPADASRHAVYPAAKAYEPAIGSRFKCGKGPVVNGVQRVKVCFEDSTNGDHKDLILLFEARGVTLDIEGLEGNRCGADVKINVDDDC